MTDKAMATSHHSEAIQPFRSILIYGMGLMGTSLAYAVRQAAPHTRLCGIVRSRQSANYLKEKKLLDQIIINAKIEDTAAVPYNMYEFIILAIPIQQILQLIPHLPPIQGLISDVSSAQVSIQHMFAQRPELRFANSHPLCGSHKQGPQAAIKNLYAGHTCLLSTHKNRQDELAILSRFWRSLGMQTYHVNAGQHDAALATLSHVPHLIAGILCLWANGDENVRRLRRKIDAPLVGGGFQDMTRIAGSNPEMWADIVNINREHLIATYSKLEENVAELLRALKKETKRSYWLNWFKKAAKARTQICEQD